MSIYSRVTIVGGMLVEKTIREASAKQMAQFTVNLRTMVAGPMKP